MTDLSPSLIKVHGIHGPAKGENSLESELKPESSTTPWEVDLDFRVSARIMSFNHEFLQRPESIATRRDLDVAASRLLNGLLDHRKTDEESKRNIVFLCHDIGGTIVKKARFSHNCQRVLTVLDM